MKHGSHETFNNTVYHYQTPFNVALILEQVSNHNNVLREQSNEEKSLRIKTSMISEENMIRPRISARTKEHAPKVLKEKTEIMKVKLRKKTSGLIPKSAC